MEAPNHSPNPWPAPQSPRILNASLSLPGSKSLTNRELVLASLADGPAVLRGGLVARDTELMMDALEALGGAIIRHGDTWSVTPINFGQISDGPVTIQCGLAGTVMRFVPPLVLLGFQPVTFDGDERARQRPMSPVIDALRQLGARVDDDDRGALPFTVYPGGLPTSAHTVQIDASQSSQFVSALLLVAPRLQAPLTIEHTGSSLPSLPHIDMTIDCLRRRGVSVEIERGTRWTIEPQPIDAEDTTIEPDLSNAAPFLAAALVAGGQVTVTDWPATTTQVGGLLPGFLTEFGAVVERDGDTLSVEGPRIGPGVGLQPVSMDLSAAGELAPTLVSLSLFSTGTSRFSGIGHLRGHETDRLKALVDNITALGGVATETSDGIIVTPAPLRGGPWRAFGDHRMATSGALVGLGVAGVEVDDIAQTDKTLPEFLALWASLLEQE